MLRARFGEFGKQYYEGMLNTPLGDKLALRINGVFNKSDGWMQDAATGAGSRPRGKLGRPCGTALGAFRQDERDAVLGP